MSESKPCLYCGAEIREGKRGVRLANRKTCGAADCRREHRKVLARNWTEENPDYFLLAKREWRRRNPERYQQVNRAWWDANREQQYKVNSAWRAANRERHQLLIREWERRNPVARAGYHAQRRGWKRDGWISTRDWERLVNRCGGRCYYCGSGDDLTVDHVIPLSRGGRHTIGNVLPACLSCNSRKQDKFLVEWRAGRCRGGVRTSTTSGRRSAMR